MNSLEDYDYGQRLFAPTGRNDRSKLQGTLGEPSWWTEFWDVVEFILVFIGECMRSVYEYIFLWLKWKLSNGTKPTNAPEWQCWLVTAVTTFWVLGLFGLLVYFLGEPIFGGIQGVFSFVFDFGSYFTGFFGNLTNWIKTLMGYGFDLANYLAQATYSDPRIWYVNLVTLYVWAAEQIYIEWLEGETKFRDTLFYKVFEVLDWPVSWLLDQIKDLFGSGVIYWISKAIFAPFETAILLLSMVIGGICYVIQEIIDLLKEKETS